MLLFTLWEYHTLSAHINRGNPFSPSIQHGGCASHGGWSHVNEEFCWTVISKGWNKLSTKKVRPREFQGDIVLKIHYLFNQNPGAKRCLITKDGDKFTQITFHSCFISFTIIFASRIIFTCTTKKSQKKLIFFAKIPNYHFLLPT